MNLTKNQQEGQVPGVRNMELIAVLAINWGVLFACFLINLIDKPDPRAYLVFTAMLLPLALSLLGVVKSHWRELVIHIGMTLAIGISFFTSWAPSSVVLLFISTGLLALMYLLRPWGGTYFVITAILITTPIAMNMMGQWSNEYRSDFPRIAILITSALMSAASAYGIAKQSKGLRNETNRAKNLVRMMEVVHKQFTEVITHSENLTEALWKVVDLCIPVLGLEDCVIYIKDPKDNYLKQVAAYGPKSLTRGEILSPVKIKIGEGIVGSAAREKAPVLVNDTSQSEAYILDDQKRLSELAVPILFEGQVFGVIDSEHEQKNFFTNDHIVLFQMIATLCSGKIGELELLEAEVEKARTERELVQVNELENLRHTFLNNLSHDLRTPLSLIKGPLLELQKLNEPEVKKLSDVALRNAERLNEMVSGLLDMHKLERGALKPHLSTSDLNTRMREWHGLFLHEAERRGIRYGLQMDEMKKLNCDVSKIGQIVQNLLSNAFKFTPDKGQISLTVKLDGETLKLEVADSGPGVKEEFRWKVFERFFKLNPDSHIEGTGLGLAMVKEYTDLLDGKVSIDESKSGGALFRVNIPVSEIQEVHESTVVSEAESKSLVVLIEDHPEMNAFILSLLEKDHEVKTALNAEDGWELITEHLPDLVITDLMLPGMSGEMLCKRIKNNVATDHLPVLALSAKQSTETKIDLYSLGADNYMTKPFDSDELRTLVKSMIQQRSKLKDKLSGQSTPQTSRTQGMRLIDQKISENLNNPDFGPRELEKLIGLNRNQLQKKIKSVTGFTPVEYIRNNRLHHAKSMLHKGVANVSEAAFASGFNQLAYFSKTYKAFFGVSPSEDVSKEKA